MAITHDPSNINGIIDWTNEVRVIDNQFGFIRSMGGMFNTQATSQDSIIFDRVKNTINMMSEGSAQSKSHGVGKDREVEQIAMLLKFYKEMDYIDVYDIQSQRMPGSPDMSETLANVRATKLEDLRLAHDQRDEYLRFKAMTGALPTGAVAGQTDMYGVYGLNKAADFTVDLDTGNSSVDLDAKIASVKRKIASGIKSGTPVQGIDFFLDYALFDEIIANPKFREVYNMYQNSGKQLLRDDLSAYYSWGVTDFFEHRGVRFIAYNPTFLEADGSEVTVLGAGKGIAIPRAGRDLLRGYYGPANKLSLANQGGQEMFAFERTSTDDESHTLEIQSKKLYFATKPEAIIQLT